MRCTRLQVDVRKGPAIAIGVRTLEREHNGPLWGFHLDARWRRGIFIWGWVGAAVGLAAAQHHTLWAEELKHTLRCICRHRQIKGRFPAGVVCVLPSNMSS